MFVIFVSNYIVSHVIYAGLYKANMAWEFTVVYMYGMSREKRR